MLLFQNKYLKKGLLIASTLLVLIVFSTCKKYPEGGFLQRGPKILIKNSWWLTLYEVNGIDSTDLINYNGDDKYKQVIFKKEPGKYNHQLYGENYDTFVYKIYFIENNSKISFSNENGYNVSKFCFTNGNCFKLFFNPEGKTCTWEILKLTKKELILISNQNNSYKLKFKCR